MSAVDELKEALKRIRKEGYSLDLLTEHIVRKCAAVCDEVAHMSDSDVIRSNRGMLCRNLLMSTLMSPPDEIE